MRYGVCTMHAYQTKTFALGTLQGLSQKQIDEHLKLYAGYVKNVNALMDRVQALKADSATNALELSELTRRFAFEFNGMRLHEYYFSQFEQTATAATTIVKDAITAQWGSYEAWVAECTSIGLMRGIGWVLLVQDEVTQNLHNIWVSDHEVGHLAGQKVLLALDMWEHAFLFDYVPAGKKDYIAAFFKNLNWSVVESRA